MENLLEIILNTDNFLLEMVTENIYKAYFLLFLLIMLETGLIIFPFLPGDGLLFSAGVVAASTEINIWLLLVLLIIAATLGNLLNYNFGKYLRPYLKRLRLRFLKRIFRGYFQKTENFYKEHGGKAIIIGRFFPIIRTYIPFFAGVASMKFNFFIKNTVIGAIIWILIFLLTGFFIGKIEWVKNNYGILVFAILIFTIIPFLYKIISSLFKGLKNSTLNQIR